jgi:hypothetical protein
VHDEGMEAIRGKIPNPSMWSSSIIMDPWRKRLDLYLETAGSMDSALKWGLIGSRLKLWRFPWPTATEISSRVGFSCRVAMGSSSMSTVPSRIKLLEQSLSVGHP